MLIENISNEELVDLRARECEKNFDFTLLLKQIKNSKI